jgi:UDP-N-acetylmuramyl pentapeptide synthase
LSKLLEGVDAQLEGSDPDIAEVRDDPAHVMPGDLYVAVLGPGDDGHARVKQAAERGARAVIIEWPVVFAGARVLVPSAVEALQQIRANQKR